MSHSQNSPATSPPEAVIVESNRSRAVLTKVWWITGLCAAVAAILLGSFFVNAGRTIEIHFDNAAGLRVGDALRYRGMDVGYVERIRMSSDRENIDVEVKVLPGNENLAVEGSQFWVQRPVLSAGQMRGLDTIVGARYIEVLPGPIDAERRSDFSGLRDPLTLSDDAAVEIKVTFPTGQGIRVGSIVQYRDMTIGEVTDLTIDGDFDAVIVSIRLVGGAVAFARSGTQFWIERPRIELTEIRNLDSLLSGAFIAVQPSIEKEIAVSFEGLAEPPPMPRESGSLEIELDAADRSGLVRGAPVLFRGIEVGRVNAVDLAGDAASVKVSVVVAPKYAALVRKNTKWWVINGLQIQAGLAGLDVSVESLSSWLRGGIAFATPEDPGENVPTGYRFMLERQPQAEWLTWQPRVALHATGTEYESSTFPRAIRYRVIRPRWGNIFAANIEESWALPFDDGRVYFGTTSKVSSLLSSDTPSNEMLEIGGVEFLIKDLVAKASGNGDFVDLSELAVERWPIAKVSSDWNRTVMLVISPELLEPIAIDSTRLQRDAVTGHLLVAKGVPLSSQLEGSPVLAETTGDVFGVLRRIDDQWQVVPIALP